MTSEVPLAWYRYTFSDTDFAVTIDESDPGNFDPRHRE